MFVFSFFLGYVLLVKKMPICVIFFSAAVPSKQIFKPQKICFSKRNGGRRDAPSGKMQASFFPSAGRAGRKDGDHTAIFHCTLSNISRAKGSSTCATAAYITGQKIYEDRTGQMYEYGRKQRVFNFESVGLSHVALPADVPETYNSVSVLANAIENYEQADNARCAKKEEFSLPIEATTEQKIAIARKHIDDCYTAKGYACIWAIHDIDGDNPHAHIIIINRKINEQGEFEKFKTKTVYDRDENGGKIPVYETQRDTSGKILKDENGKRLLVLDDDGNPIQSRDKNGKLLYKRIKTEENYLDRQGLITEVRKNLEVHINAYLPPDLQVDCRSLEEQGIDRLPTVHEGYAARGMEARGIVSERGEINRQIVAENLRRLVTKIKTKVLTAMNKVMNQDTVIDHHAPHDYDSSYDYVADPGAILCARSENPLTKGLIESRTYEINDDNLQAVAQTVACLNKHGIDSHKKYKEVYETITTDINKLLSEYQAIAESLDVTNQKMTYRKTMNRYKNIVKTYFDMSNKTDIISRRKAKNFYAEHKNEIDLYAQARDYIQKQSGGKIPKTKEIEQEIDNLSARQKEVKNSFIGMRTEGWTLFDAHKNLTAVLGPDPLGWHPTNTIDYRIAHDLPKELTVSREHNIKSIKDTRSQERQAREMYNSHQQDEPCL